MPEGLAGLDPRGIILFGHFKRPPLRSYARLGVPTVLLDWPNPAWKGHALHVDNVAAAEDAVGRLASLGHRHIAFAQQLSLVQSDLDLDARERAAGFAKGLEAAGLASRRETVFTFLPPKQGESPALKRVLRARPAFTAVLTAGQRQAVTIIDAARAAGRSVPGDLSVASFQPVEGALRAGISGPCVDFESMGREAVKLLAFPSRPPQRRRFPATWREGRTVGKP
jgi:DNA-binding LacI/PurR family transcriptional regulator